MKAAKTPEDGILCRRLRAGTGSGTAEAGSFRFGWRDLCLVHAVSLGADDKKGPSL